VSFIIVLFKPMKDVMLEYIMNKAIHYYSCNIK